VLVLFGVLIAGIVYAFVVVQAVNQRSHVPHVHKSSTH
jgi:hypothetical protein